MTAGSKGIKSELIIIFTLLMFVFNTKFIIFGNVFSSYWVFVFGFACFEIFRFGVNKYFLPYILLTVIATIYALCIHIFFRKDVFETIIFVQILSSIFVLFSSSVIVRMHIYAYKRKWLDKLIRNLLITAVVNSIFIFGAASSDGFRDIIYDFIFITERATRYAFEMQVHNPRYPGLNVSGFTAGSLLVSLIVLSVSLYSLHKRGVGIFHYITLSQVFVVSSLAFVARTGLYLSTLIVTIQIFRELFLFLKIPLKMLFVSILSLGAAMYWIANLKISHISPMLESQLIDHTGFFWAFEPFVNYFVGYDLQSTATDALLSEAFLSNDILEILFGTGILGRAEVYLNSDTGWILFISFGGVLGTFILYTPLFYLGISGFCHGFSDFYRRYLLFSIVCLLIVNFKEIVYLSHGYIQLPMLFFTAGIHSLRTEKSGL